MTRKKGGLLQYSGKIFEKKKKGSSLLEQSGDVQEGASRKVRFSFMQREIGRRQKMSAYCWQPICSVTEGPAAT